MKVQLNLIRLLAIFAAALTMVGQASAQQLSAKGGKVRQAR